MRSSLLLAAFSAALLLFPVKTSAQKAMDHDVYDTWQKVDGITVTDDGRYVGWMVNPQEGDGTLYIRSFIKTKKKTTESKELEIPRGTSLSLDQAGRWAYCRIKPQFAKSRQEKIAKKKDDDKTPDTLAVIDLAKMQIVARYPKMKSFATGKLSSPAVAFKCAKDSLYLLDPATSKIDTILNADNFSFNPDGSLLVVMTKKVAKKKDKPEIPASITLRTLDGAVDTLAKGAEKYLSPVFNDDNTMLVFKATADSNKTGDKRCSIIAATLGDKITTKEIFAQGTKVAGTDGWTVNENGAPYFSRDGKRLFMGIAPIRPPKDTTIVDFETASLDIWNWDAPYTPPQQKMRLNSIKTKTYLAVMDLESGKIVPLTTSSFDRISLIDGGCSDIALSSDDRKYAASSIWNDDSKNDIAFVSLKDGSRKVFAEGMDARVSLSPAGKYLIWFSHEDRDWHTYNIATGAYADLTSQTNSIFWDEQTDTPSEPEPYDRMPQWTKDDQSVLVADRYDVWKIAPDGSSAVKITDGRDAKIRFRLLNPKPARIPENAARAGVMNSIDPAKTLYLSAFNEEDMRHGYGTTSLTAKKKTVSYFLDTLSFNSVIMPRESDEIVFTKGNFRNPYDLYISTDYFKTDTRLTSINPQMKDYRWGEVSLFSWKAYDGTPLKGLVFMPDGVKPDEKLPVMIYFYERNSETLYDFRTPSPSRSTVNIPLFTSRGYIVFVPDIVYKTGHPGESAYNCICSGAEALCDAYPNADKTKMAIQGQSWGGYQTAYLVTRTNMFAAAGAGAPVGNMTSAYGGIRWGSGMVRAGQYEHGQSRIGKSLWDDGAIALYLENSPVFHVDNCTTPVLIMHNDNDGAVPWYQGIEFFSDLRRLGKPAWLLEYINEEHNLVERRNCKDLSRRLTQFFDYYLKGAPMPAWMKSGVPTDRKGEYFGFENAE